MGYGVWADMITLYVFTSQRIDEQPRLYDCSSSSSLLQWCIPCMWLVRLYEWGSWGARIEG